MGYSIIPLKRKNSNGVIDQDRIVPLTIIYRHGSKQKQISTQIKERRRDFIYRKNRIQVSSSCNEAEIKNKKINEIRLQLERLETFGSIKSIEEYGKEIRKILKIPSTETNNNKSTRIEYLVKDYLSSIKSKSTLKTLKYRLGLFIKYLEAHGVHSIDNISAHHLTGFKDDLVKQRFRNRSTKAILEKVKAFIKWCNKKDFIIVAEDILEWKVKLKQGKGLTINLLESEINKLENTVLCGIHDQIRDLALFQLYTGQRFGDVHKFRPNQVINGCWNFIQEKTGNPMDLNLHPKIMSILDKYRHHPKGLPNFSSQYFNNQLKKLCKTLNLNRIVTDNYIVGEISHLEHKNLYEMITSHDLRHTFISTSLGRGVHYKDVMYWSGHTSLKSFEKYINSSLQESGKKIANAWNKNSLN